MHEIIVEPGTPIGARDWPQLASCDRVGVPSLIISSEYCMPRPPGSYVETAVQHRAYD